MKSQSDPDIKRNIPHFLKMGDHGIALIMILWILILLDIIVLQFASSMRTEAEITRNFRDRIEAYYLARAAIELAKYELMYVASVSKNPPVADSRGTIDFRSEKLERETNPQWKREINLGRGTSTIKYFIKEDKYDINYLATRNDRELEEVLVACGLEAASSELSMIKRSIIDWVDPDHDLSGPDIGAEDDWYKDNWEGYECKDDRFYAIEELAFIRDLRPEKSDSEEEREEKERLLKELYKRLDAHPILIHTKLNQNVATRESLDVKYDEEQIITILEERDEGKVQDSQAKTPHYEVIATGRVKGSLAERQIKVEFYVNRPKNIQSLSWTDNYIPVEEWDPNQEIMADEMI